MDRSATAPVVHGVFEEIGLDAGSDHRTFPPQDGGNCQSGRLVRLRRAEDDHRLGPLRGHRLAAHAAQGQPTGHHGLGPSLPWHPEGLKVPGSGPGGTARSTRPSADRCPAATTDGRAPWEWHPAPGRGQLQAPDAEDGSGRRGTTRPGVVRAEQARPDECRHADHAEHSLGDAHGTGSLTALRAVPVRAVPVPSDRSGTWPVIA